MSSDYTKKEDEPFGVGEIVYLSSGVYSDYSVGSVCRVVKAFEAKDFGKGKNRYGVHIDCDRLLAEGYLEEIPARELWCGDN